MLYRQLWAKSYPDDPTRFHPLWCHLLDVAAVCEALLPRFGGVPGLPDTWVPYLAALHDVGKADARFQGKAPNLVVPGVPADTEGECRGFRHEARSADWLAIYLKAVPLGWGRDAARVVAQATRGHHGDFQADAYNEAEWTWMSFYGPVRDQLGALVAEMLGIQPAALDRFDHASVSGIRLSGLIVLADWIASNPETYRYPDLYPDRPPYPEPVAYFAAARDEARQAVQKLELDAGRAAPPAGRYGFTDVWPGLKAYPPRPSQQALQNAIQNVGVPPGLAIIEAPMGEGKTEAAIYLAVCWGRSGAYVALPTQATGNQMHRRYARFLQERDPEGPPPRLVHGMAWLQDGVAPDGVSRTEDERERLRSREWFASAKRALLAQDGVGTVDQVLMAALNVKHGFLRLLGLTTKTLIIDEVHAYDVYVTTLMKTLLRWCRALDVPVILLSATLSRAQKVALAEAYGAEGALPPGAARPEDEPYPLLTFVPREGPSFVQEVPADPSRDRVIRVEPHPATLDDPAETGRLAAASVAGGGCACVLANTVASAQKIFRALQADPPPDTQLFLFHARFRAERRQGIEDRVVGLFGKGQGNGPNPDRPGRAILVATQVVEQSLDIDFDVLLSQVAPVDLLLQRAGRLHRHRENDPRPTGPEAVLYVLLPSADTPEPEFGGMEVKKRGKDWRGVYDRAALLRTMALLESKANIQLPADFRPLIEGCYGDAPLPVSAISPEWIQQAEQLRDARRAESERAAKTHLVPDPNLRVFEYAQGREPGEEGEEGERASFFRAQTREGDDSRAVLVLHDPDLVAAVTRGVEIEREPEGEWRPGKERLKALFLQKASLPAYWLSHVAASEGYEMLTEVPKRLRHHVILIMQGGRWEGIQTRRDKDTGRDSVTRVTITDDPILGLSWSSGAAEKETEAEKEAEDADV